MVVGLAETSVLTGRSSRLSWILKSLGWRIDTLFSSWETTWPVPLRVHGPTVDDSRIHSAQGQ